jgi:hypothetical protein
LLNATLTVRASESQEVTKKKVGKLLLTVVIKLISDTKKKIASFYYGVILLKAKIKLNRFRKTPRFNGCSSFSLGWRRFFWM